MRTSLISLSIIAAFTAIPAAAQQVIEADNVVVKPDGVVVEQNGQTYAISTPSARAGVDCYERMGRRVCTTVHRGLGYPPEAQINQNRGYGYYGYRGPSYGSYGRGPQGIPQYQQRSNAPRYYGQTPDRAPQGRSFEEQTYDQPQSSDNRNRGSATGLSARDQGYNGSRMRSPNTGSRAREGRPANEQRYNPR